MKKILFIDDQPIPDAMALTFALSLAAKMDASLLIARSLVTRLTVKEKELAGHASNNISETYEAAAYAPGSTVQTVIDISVMNTQELAQMICREGIHLIVRRAARSPVPARLNLEAVLARVHCPLLLLPGNWVLKDLQRLAYLTDLRYCRTDILFWLAKFAATLSADVSVAHLTKSGLVHIEQNYAHQLFEEQIRSQIKYDHLNFHYTREWDVSRAADVLTNAMLHDLLVVTRNHYHYNGLTGAAATGCLPENIQIPLLIFPG